MKKGAKRAPKKSTEERSPLLSTVLYLERDHGRKAVELAVTQWQARQGKE